MVSEPKPRSKEGRDTCDSLTNVDTRSSSSWAGPSSGILARFSSRTKRTFSGLAKPKPSRLGAQSSVPRSQDLETFHFSWFETPPLVEVEKKRRESPFARLGIGSRRSSSSSCSTAVKSSSSSTPATDPQCSLDLPALPDFLVKLPADENSDSLVWAQPDDLLASVFPPVFDIPPAPRIACIDLPPCADPLSDPSTLDLPRALANIRPPSSHFSDWTPTVASAASLSSIVPSFAFETPTRQPSPYKNVRTLFPPRPSTLERIDSSVEGWKTNKCDKDEDEAEKAREALKEAFEDLAEVRLVLASSSVGESVGRMGRVVGRNDLCTDVSRGRSSTRTATMKTFALPQVEVGTGD
ncbi:hypothetical protein JCM10295v2_001601 [Rhodotorula toruloides]